MKRIMYFVLLLLICLSLYACGSSNSGNEQSSEVTIEIASTEATPSATEDDTHFQVITKNGHTLTIEKPKDTVDVTRNDGTTETTNSWELTQIHCDNEVKFEKNYMGAFVKIIAPVESVHGRTIVDGYDLPAYVELAGGWKVEADKNDPLLEELSPGDMVVATGCIYSMFGGLDYDGVVMTVGTCKVYSTSEVKTTLERYTD